MNDIEASDLAGKIHKLTGLDWDKKEFAGADSFRVWFYLRNKDDSDLIKKYLHDNGVKCSFWTEADCFVMEV